MGLSFPAMTHAIQVRRKQWLSHETQMEIVCMLFASPAFAMLLYVLWATFFMPMGVRH